MNVSDIRITEIYQVSFLNEIPELLGFTQEEVEDIECNGELAEHYGEVMAKYGFVLYETLDWWYIIGVLIT